MEQHPRADAPQARLSAGRPNGGIRCGPSAWQPSETTSEPAAVCCPVRGDRVRVVSVSRDAARPGAARLPRSQGSREGDDEERTFRGGGTGHHFLEWSGDLTGTVRLSTAHPPARADSAGGRRRRRAGSQRSLRPSGYRHAVLPYRRRYPPTEKRCWTPRRRRSASTSATGRAAARAVSTNSLNSSGSPRLTKASDGSLKGSQKIA